MTAQERAELRHDLRNPIGLILGYAEMLQEDAAEQGEPPPPDLERIRSAAQRLLDLIALRLADPDSIEPEKTAPLNDSDDSVEDLSAPTRDDGLSENSGICLVVDDSAENREMLARRLQRLGHLTVPAASGAEALQTLETVPVDMVLLDVQMPDMNGYVVLETIKTNPRWATLPVLMISAVDDMDSIARCITLGAADYLPKGFDPVLLQARVNACLRDKRAHDRETLLATQLRENLERRQAAEKLRDDLTHMIVHDLRTPLTSLLTGVQSIGLMGELNPDQQEMTALAEMGGQTLLGMINDLLDIGKMETGTITLEREMLRPDDLAARAVEQVTLIARQKQIHLRIAMAPDLPMFSGDEDKLRRTLVNLLGNALKFTPAEGAVTLACDRLGADFLRFSVQDTGEGIPKEAFQTIFEKFGQVESRRAGRKMSTGLGLTFCRLAIEAHGGEIGVESEMGQGSTFWFTVPTAAR